MRLGFPVRVHGRSNLPSHDGRPAHEDPHLGLSLAYLHDILSYLAANQISMYRMHSELVPGALQRPWTDLAGEIAACARQLALLGEMAQQADIRLSIHAPAALALNALDEDLAQRAQSYLRAQAALMDAMGLDRSAVIVLHVGGVYDDLARSRERFLCRYGELAHSVRHRLALENDDRRFGFLDVSWIHERSGIPLVFDNLHHALVNPNRVPLRAALSRCMQTWPTGVTPKIHYATPRTEIRSQTGGLFKAPTWTEHSDYVSPFAFAAFVAEADGLPDMDIMLEAKARDLALLKLREDLARYEPGLSRKMR